MPEGVSIPFLGESPPSTTAAAASSASVIPQALLAVRLRAEPEGPVIEIEPVTARDLVDPIAELWFRSSLRRGYGQIDLADLRAELEPVLDGDAGAEPTCSGFELVTTDANGDTTRCWFPRDCLGHIAARGARRPLARGELESGQNYYYDVVPAAPRPDAPIELYGPPGRGVPELLIAPLAPLLERATPRGGPVVVGDFPIFITAGAVERAERIARKGASESPPIESGGLLLGPLCQCPESGEFFAVALDVIQATNSEATTYSLTYSGETWSRVQNILRARKANPATRHERLIGQFHGHNFLPLAGAPPCEACDIVDVCTRSSAHISSDDRTWCRSVFSAEPWQLSMIFGHDAKGRDVENFYGQHGGTLVRRAFYVIDALDDLLPTPADLDDPSNHDKNPLEPRS